MGDPDEPAATVDGITMEATAPDDEVGARRAAIGRRKPPASLWFGLAAGAEGRHASQGNDHAGTAASKAVRGQTELQSQIDTARDTQAQIVVPASSRRRLIGSLPNGSPSINSKRKKPGRELTVEAPDEPQSRSADSPWRSSPASP